MGEENEDETMAQAEKKDPEYEVFPKAVCRIFPNIQHYADPAGDLLVLPGP